MQGISSGVDHLVVTAPTLESGVSYVEGLLGCRMEAGGRHPRMGTHNRLLRVGADVYLEVLAIDPGAEAPGRPRWFGLDELGVDAEPRLSAWVMRTNGIRELAGMGLEGVGEVELMQRGDLEWWITISGNGRGVLGGVIPPLIEWRTEGRPGLRLPESGVELLKLELIHREVERVGRWLGVAGFSGLVELREPEEGCECGVGAVLRRGDGVEVRMGVG